MAPRAPKTPEPERTLTCWCGRPFGVCEPSERWKCHTSKFRWWTGHKPQRWASVRADGQAAKVRMLSDQVKDDELVVSADMETGPVDAE